MCFYKVLIQRLLTAHLSGLGNDRSNSLPPCQLLKLQDLVNGLYVPSEQPIAFWIDTLCVPRRYPERGLAIAQMRDIYAGADKVLVLDAVFSRISEQSSAMDRLMSLRASNWARRLWTFHEAALAKELYYQFPDGAMTTKEMYRRCAEEESLASAEFHIEKYWAYDTLDPVSCIEMEPGSLEWREARAKLKRPEELMFLNPMMAGLHLKLAEIEANFAAMYRLSRFEDAQDHQRLRRATAALQTRKTSRIEDEPICIAGILGADVGQLIELGPLDRMKKLLGSLQNVPADILFLDKPRVPEDGCRWMPATFIGPGISDMTSTTEIGKPVARGLQVELPGFLLSEAHKSVECQFPTSGTTMLSFLVHSHIRVVVLPKEAAFRWQSYENMELAILLDGGLDKGAMMIPGILVNVREKIDQVNYCRLECLVNVIALTEQAEPWKAVVSDVDVTDIDGFTILEEWCVG